MIKKKESENAVIEKIQEINLNIAAPFAIGGICGVNLEFLFQNSQESVENCRVISLKKQVYQSISLYFRTIFIKQPTIHFEARKIIKYCYIRNSFKKISALNLASIGTRLLLFTLFLLEM
ncbi:hypothetical protein PPE03_26390 [Pseudoalteromonas peptidolytica]|nr:hypothetical protein PPE03_26390 [Pseudoalteromonas peptidolytica]